MNKKTSPIKITIDCPGCIFSRQLGVADRHTPKYRNVSIRRPGASSINQDLIYPSGPSHYATISGSDLMSISRPNRKVSMPASVLCTPVGKQEYLGYLCFIEFSCYLDLIKFFISCYDKQIFKGWNNVEIVMGQLSLGIGKINPKLDGYFTFPFNNNNNLEKINLT